MKNVKKGFTLIELIVVIAIMGLIGGSVTGLLIFGLDIFGLANRDFQMQTDVRMALEDTSKLVRFAKAMFAVPDVDYKDDEWNYIGLNEDSTMIVNYVWDPSLGSDGGHQAIPMVGPYEGVTFNIGFYKEDNMQKDNTIQVYFEMFHQDGTVKRFNIQTGYEALNSLQVVDYGTELNPARALAYRSDDFHYENYLLKVNITLILDISGSMDFSLTGVQNNVSYNDRRVTIMKNQTKALIESFATNTNDDVEINIALVPFNGSANSVKVFRNVKTEKASLISDVNSLCGGLNNNQDCEGGTNTGDGMRRAYYRLLQKSQAQANDSTITRDYKIKNYNIFLSDGATSFRSLNYVQTGTESVYECSWWGWNCRWVDYPVFSSSHFTADGNIQEKYPPANGPAGIYYESDGSGTNTSATEWDYVETIGAMLGGILPVTGHDEELTVTSYVIGFTEGISQEVVYDIAGTMNVPDERVYFANDEDSLSLSFSDIQLSITNDTWHYLGPKLVE